MCSKYCYVESSNTELQAQNNLMLTFFSCDSMDFNFCSSIIILFNNKCVCSLYREGERGPHKDSFNFQQLMLIHLVSPLQLHYFQTTAAEIDHYCRIN